MCHHYTDDAEEEPTEFDPAESELFDEAPAEEVELLTDGGDED